MRPFLLLFFLFFVEAFPCYASEVFWGKTGHRVVGEVAERHLTRRARKAIEKLLDGESLALVSNYADDIKSDPEYKKYSPWHYVNFPYGKKYGEESPSTSGDLITGIEKCISVLEDEESSEEDKAFYLRLLVHFIGDLHQPLHVGRAEDRGGNDIEVSWFGDDSNLHRVWDSDMIDSFGMSYTEISVNLPRITKKQRRSIQSGSYMDWAYESQELSKTVYGSAQMGEKLGYRYMYDNFGMAKLQLQKGGLRLAKLLNDIFG